MRIAARRTLSVIAAVAVATLIASPAASAAPSTPLDTPVDWGHATIIVDLEYTGMPIKSYTVVNVPVGAGPELSYLDVDMASNILLAGDVVVDIDPDAHTVTLRDGMNPGDFTWMAITVAMPGLTSFSRLTDTLSGPVVSSIISHSFTAAPPFGTAEWLGDIDVAPGDSGRAAVFSYTATAPPVTTPTTDPTTDPSPSPSPEPTPDQTTDPTANPTPDPTATTDPTPTSEPAPTAPATTEPSTPPAQVASPAALLPPTMPTPSSAASSPHPTAALAATGGSGAGVVWALALLAAGLLVFGVHARRRQSR